MTILGALYVYGFMWVQPSWAAIQVCDRSGQRQQQQFRPAAVLQVVCLLDMTVHRVCCGNPTVQLQFSANPQQIFSRHVLLRIASKEGYGPLAALTVG